MPPFTTAHYGFVIDLKVADDGDMDQLYSTFSDVVDVIIERSCYGLTTSAT